MGTLPCAVAFPRQRWAEEGWKAARPTGMLVAYHRHRQSALGGCTTMHHPGVFVLWGQDPGFAPQYQFVCYTVQLQILLTVMVVTCTGCTLTISCRFSETAKSRLKAVFEWHVGVCGAQRSVCGKSTNTEKALVWSLPNLIKSTSALRPLATAVWHTDQMSCTLWCGKWCQSGQKSLRSCRWLMS